MKKIYFLLVFLSSLLMSQEKANALSPGDIAILGYNIDAPNQEFCFLLLTDIPSGTVIHFTDFGWCSGGSYTGFQSYLPCGANSGAGSDGAITWTSTVPMSCGTQVRVQCRNNLSASAGTVTGLQTQGSINTDYMTLTTNGDQIFAFQGTLAAPTFITGLNTQGTGWATTLNQCDFTSLLSTLPPGLNATNSITMPVASPDNAVYNGTVNSGSPAQLKAAIFNNANWNTSETTVYTLPLAAAFSCVTCVAPAVTGNPPNRTICAGGSTTFTVTATGTLPAYQWQVNTGVGGFNNIAVGTSPYGNSATTATLTITGATATMSGYLYRCVVTGNCGTATSNNGTLTISNITSTGTQVDVLCNGSATGSATVVPSGGIVPYTYNWTLGGGTTATASNLAANTYTVTITDNIACQATRSFTITQPATAVTATTSQTNVSCNGGNDGTATVTASAGTPGYTYLWSPGGSTAATATGLTQGTYTCTIKDANLCQITRNVTVTEPAVLAATTSQTDLLCNGATNGSAGVTPTGGTPPYTYSWSPGGATTATIANIGQGTYTCIIKDSKNCQIVRNITLTQPAAALTAITSKTDVSCNGGSNGTATITASGGTAPYTYLWTPSGGTGATASGLPQGTYTCTIKDNNLCQITRNVTITEPAALGATTSQTDVLCNGATTGVGTVTASGGTPPYTYNWTPSGGTAATATNLAAGSYVCTIKDNNLCQIVRNFTIAQPATALTAIASKIDVSCNGGSNGTAMVTPSGGTPPYTYAWSPGGATTAAISGLTQGTYTCTIKDNNLCQITRNVTLGQPSAIQVAASADVSICSGSSTILISIASGGTPGYTYQWQPGNLSGNIQNVSPTTTTQYVVTATDAFSCTGKDTVIVTVDPNMAQSATNGNSIPGNATSSSNQTAGGLQSYYNSTCGLIASVQQNAGLGNITASVTVLNNVQVFAGRPYVARWYEVIPQNNIAGVVTLYFKQSDFNQYNAYATLNGFPLLPQNPTDQAGIDTLVITKISGGTLGSGTASLIQPTSVVWDAVMQYWKVTFSTPSFSQFFIHAKNAAGTPLPVAYSAFEAIRENKTALLSWTTATERNNSGFSIERSTNGKNFAAIGWVATQAEGGNSVAPVDYRFTDKAPATGMNYYRLQQKDKDGQTAYSIIRSLDFGNGAAFTCYPNPATEMLTIEHQSATEAKVHFQLIDVTSRMVYQQDVPVRKGFNKNMIDLSGLPQGMYQLIIADNNGILFRSKIIKK